MRVNCFLPVTNPLYAGFFVYQARHKAQPGLFMKQIVFKTKYLRDVQLFYRDHCHSSNTMLLESAEIVDKTGVRSLAGMSCALKVYCEDLKVTATALNHNGSYLLADLGKKLGVEVNGDSLSIQYRRPETNLDEFTRLKAPGPLDVMRALRELISPCDDIMISGVIAFDFINNFEYIGDVPKGENPCADYTFYVFDISIKSNHIKEKTRIYAYAFGPESYQETALKALKLRDAVSDYETRDDVQPRQSAKLIIDPDLSDAQFGEIVRKLKEHIIRGDAFQVVPSRTFRTPCKDPLLAYSFLKKINPSPYMFYLRDPLFTLFGASPEFALRYKASNHTVNISPIAGTRGRGLKADGSIDPELDARIELELRTDKKEGAEHLMLVDLARNDLARIAKPGSRYVNNMLHVDKYQSVMHLVSDVHAVMRDDLDALHAYLACMNMGTLSGAPKIKAHELIYKYEGKKRGSYGGVIALLENDGSFDSCITIRSAFVKNQTAYVQAGCGVVYDSDIPSECQETVNKARSVLSALSMAAEELK